MCSSTEGPVVYNSRDAGAASRLSSAQMSEKYLVGDPEFHPLQHGKQDLDVRILSYSIRRQLALYTGYNLKVHNNIKKKKERNLALNCDRISRKLICYYEDKHESRVVFIKEIIAKKISLDINVWQKRGDENTITAFSESVMSTDTSRVRVTRCTLSKSNSLFST